MIPHLPESKVKGTERNEYSREESYVIFMFLNQITYMYINMRKTKKIKILTFLISDVLLRNYYEEIDFF